MKIAVIVPAIGNLDEIHPLEKQSMEYELHYITENTLPFPLPNLDNRMKGKYFKCQAHKFIEADIYIHLDASVEVISKDFIDTCIKELYGVDIVIEKHKHRNNVYDELIYIIEKMKAGDKYLLRRYAKQPFYIEYDFYKKNGLPIYYPLYQCFFFARKNNERVNEMFDKWWDLNLTYSNFDQAAFSFAAWSHDMNINTIETEDLFIRHKHVGYNL